MAQAGGRLRSAIHDAAITSSDSGTYVLQVLAALQKRVPFDAGCFGTMDPAALLPTSLTTVGFDGPGVYATVLDIEYGDGAEPHRFESIRNRKVPVRTLREATGGHAASTRFYADVLAPYGLRDEVRMLFRARDGNCWGGLTISRAGREFGDDEVLALSGVLADVADGLRAVLVREAHRVPSAAPQGPAMAVIGHSNELEAATAAALDYLARLGWGPPSRPVTDSPAAAIATWLRHSGTESTVLRVRTTDGQWVVVRAAGCDGATPHRQVAMTFEPARPPQVASIVALAQGLTSREGEVLVHVLAGESRSQMAQALFISPYTVQDHLKNIYAKTGVTSRRELVAMLVRQEYLPRLGSPLSPDGWFVAAGRTSA